MIRFTFEDHLDIDTSLTLRDLGYHAKWRIEFSGPDESAPSMCTYRRLHFHGDDLSVKHVYTHLISLLLREGEPWSVQQFDRLTSDENYQPPGFIS